MIGDREHLQHQLEAMKMSQATLQQLMTLSAGGLALFFSFIGKAPFVLAIEFFGSAVVIAWIISLSTAAYAHRLHAELFLSLARIVGVNREIDALGNFADEVASELKINPNSAGVVERAKYNEIIPLVQAQAAENPGVLQSSIYGAMPYQQEDVGYALYFGALLNDIRRVKKGRTYALYLPSNTYEASLSGQGDR